MAATAEVVKRHGRLLEILAAVLEGRPLREVAEAYDCPLAELQEYCRQAGLLPGAGPEPRQPDAPCSEPVDEVDVEPEDVLDRSAVHERQRPQHDQGTYLEDSRTAMRQELERIEAERRSYEEQPRPHLTLCSDPDFHTGFQPAARLTALMLREVQQRNERLREWYTDPFHWRQEPPEDWFD